jgi:catechol 2,3-dioxygenase-like lactoylglutathione lyase family enzyme
MPLPVTFDHCVVHVSDWERSNVFYRDVLGAELVRRPQGWAYRFGAAQLIAWTGLSSGRGGAPSGRAWQQRPLLPMEWADCRRHHPP